MITIFFASPNDSGHNAMILQEVEAELEKRKQKYQVIKLFEDEYDPVMHRDELYTAGGKTVSKLTKKYQNILQKNTHFIFIHPVWWNGMPAQLKGFFDKVFTSKFAFVYEKWPLIPFAIPQGLLKGKKAVVFNTTGGRWWMSLIFQGNRYQKTLVNDILKYCGMKAKGYSLHECVGRNKKKKLPQAKKIVKKGLKWLL